MIEISASILSANPSRLGEDVKAADAAGANRIHFDVMDGRFVPNITYGPLVVRAIRPLTKIVIEAHLMIVEPENFVQEFAAAGADVIIVHQETAVHLHRVIHQIKDLGKRAGVCLNPATPATTLVDILPEVDLVLVMTVNPGFGGQRFIEATVPKIEQVRTMINERGLTCAVEVDGGIDVDTAPRVVGAGANVLAAGSSIYRAPEGIAAAIQRLRKAITA